jgi:hypothetical protein
MVNLFRGIKIESASPCDCAGNIDIFAVKCARSKNDRNALDLYVFVHGSNFEDKLFKQP